MDIRMPTMNGSEATRRIKAQQSTCVIIAITGSAFEEDRLAALAVGFDDFVRKPFRTNIIFEKIAEHFGVRYVYANELDQDSVTLAASVTIADLDRMSIEWITQLHQAAIRVNAKQILKLVEQIPEPQTHLAQALIELVERFCFEEIIQLTVQRVEHLSSSAPI